MAVGENLDFYAKFEFVVEIDGIRRAGFKSCSALEMEFGEVSYREGGRLIPHKRPGLMSMPDITLERGATDDDDMLAWFKETGDAAANIGGVGVSYRRSFDIVAQNRDGSERARYSVFGAWPKKYTAGEWDSEGEEAVIESLVLACDYFQRA